MTDLAARPDATPPTAVLEALQDLPAGPVVVLMDPAADLPAWLDGSLGRKVRVVTERRRTHGLARKSRPAAVIDLMTGEKAPRRMLWSLRPQGKYVAAPGTRGPARLLRRADATPDPDEQLVQEVKRATRILVDTEGWLVALKRTPHYLMLSYDDVAQVLPQRGGGPEVTTLETLPAGSFTPAGRVRAHGAGPDPGIATRISHPELGLRHYEGVVDLQGGGGVVVAAGCVLPESFRWYDVRPLHHPRLVPVGDHFARLVRRARPEEQLEGNYFFFDYSNAGHYGHFLTEAVPRLWGWDAAKRADPTLKILLRHRDRAKPRPDPEVLEAFGIAPEDIVFYHNRVRVKSLVAAQAMWHNAPPFHAHPRLVEIWDRIRTGLIGEQRGPHERIFVTRRYGLRPCRNTRAVEELFSAQGFEIVNPGKLTRPEQALAFSGARVVAGFGGTGMFNLAFATSVQHVILLNHTAYQARNEHLFTALRGADLDYFWSEPDIAGTSYEAHQSSWEFDLEQHATDLNRLLESTA